MDFKDEMQTDSLGDIDVLSGYSTGAGPSTPGARLRPTRGSPRRSIDSPAAVASSSSGSNLQSRRSSSRSIKRKKFDDELVESSLIKTSRGRPILGGAQPFSGSWASVASPNSIEQAFAELAPIVLPEKKKTPKSTPKRIKKAKTNQSAVTKDVGRWKPADDLALIIAVQQTNDLNSVFQGVKFSCKFTLQEIQERWFALLYDPIMSRMAVSAMKLLHPEIISVVQSKALYTKEEEDLLGDISSSSVSSIEKFQDLLQKHPEVFHPARTAKALLNHWASMKQYHLLPDQPVQPLPKGEHILNFSDAEELVNDEDLQDPQDEQLEQELHTADRRMKREIRHLESELPKWQVMVDSVTGISPPDFDPQTLGVLRGRLVRYLMRSREITLGRVTKDNNVDMDLSLEGPAWKISRRQGIIKLKNCGEFYLANEGKRPIYIDSKPVLTNNKCKLNNNSVVEIAGLRFIFLINHDLINVIKTEAAKTVV